MKKQRLEDLPMHFPQIPARAGYGSRWTAMTPYYPAACYKLWNRLVDLPATPGGVLDHETQGTQTEPQPEYDFTQDTSSDEDEAVFDAETEGEEEELEYGLEYPRSPINGREAFQPDNSPYCSCCFMCRRCRQSFKKTVGPRVRYSSLYCDRCQEYDLR